MAITVTCDTCNQTIPRGAGWRVTRVGPHPTAREHGDPDGEYCSAVCVAKAASRGRGRRPDFAAARLHLQAQVDDIIADKGWRVSQLPVPDTAGQRVTAAELRLGDQ